MLKEQVLTAAPLIRELTDLRVGYARLEEAMKDAKATSTHKGRMVASIKPYAGADSSGVHINDIDWNTVGKIVADLDSVLTEKIRALGVSDA